MLWLYVFAPAQFRSRAVQYKATELLITLFQGWFHANSTQEEVPRRLCRTGILKSQGGESDAEMHMCHASLG